MDETKPQTRNKPQLWLLIRSRCFRSTGGCTGGGGGRGGGGEGDRSSGSGGSEGRDSGGRGLYTSASTSRNNPTRRICVGVNASLDRRWSRRSVLVVRPSVEAAGLTSVAWWGQCHNRSGGGVHRKLVGGDSSVRDRSRREW